MTEQLKNKNWESHLDLNRTGMDDRKEDTRVVRQVHHNHADSSFSLLHLGFAAKTNEVKI